MWGYTTLQAVQKTKELISETKYRSVTATLRPQIIIYCYSHILKQDKAQIFGS